MKTIGLIGGMSWESTLSYYKLLNEGVKAKRGGLHSAKIILHSVDFAPIARLQSEGKWEEAAVIIKEAALSLERAGVDFILLCTNTMHKILPLVSPHVKTPFLHIAEATAKTLNTHGAHKAILLGTKFTMQESFYKEVLNAHHIEVVTPDVKSIEIINQVIFQELCVGKIETTSKEMFLKIIHDLKTQDESIDAVILGCTEIGLLLDQKSSNLPLFDTTVLHVNEAINHALNQ
ncbi:aspartate/glutamate racemase family protein [Sulfurospirillum oryzae]|uniref:aspartate/glutamate racemase family protein n=1 Tax=Sulfurospirillum oryzae TaxID=2976535 RepID=UPI0021E7E9C0|nr:aspartate/glutamate racemase family protein [Sulfurospirillum oryzae]